MKTPEAMLADALTLVAQHEQTIGTLADVAKVARDALAEDEVEIAWLQAALNHAGAVGKYAMARVRELEATLEWIRAQIIELASLHTEGIVKADLLSIAADPPTEDPT